MVTRIPARFPFVILLLAALACNLPFGFDEGGNEWD